MLPRKPIRMILLVGAVAAAAALGWALFRPTRSRTDAQKRQRIQELCATYRREFPDVGEMDVDRFLQERDSRNPVLVDVRESPEQEVSMIPGAIPVSEFERNAADLKSRRIVVYCTIGYRSGMYAKRLKARGYDAWNLEGGILAWTHAGHTVVDSHGPTRRVHVYDRQWDLLPAGYTAVW